MAPGGPAPGRRPVVQVAAELPDVSERQLDHPEEIGGPGVLEFWADPADEAWRALPNRDARARDAGERDGAVAAGDLEAAAEPGEDLVRGVADVEEALAEVDGEADVAAAAVVDAQPDHDGGAAVGLVLLAGQQGAPVVRPAVDLADGDPGPVHGGDFR